MNYTNGTRSTGGVMWVCQAQQSPGNGTAIRNPTGIQGGATTEQSFKRFQMQKSQNWRTIL